MLTYSVPFMKKIFVAESQKKAQIKASKWLIKNVTCKDELKNVMITFDNKDNTSVTLTLSVGLDENTLRKRHCEICKEVHSSFFISENTNCSWCKIKAYQSRAAEIIKVQKQYYKELLKKSLEWQI